MRNVFIDLELIFLGSSRLLWIRISLQSAMLCKHECHFVLGISQSNFCIFHKKQQSRQLLSSNTIETNWQIWRRKNVIIKKSILATIIKADACMPEVQSIPLYGTKLVIHSIWWMKNTLPYFTDAITSLSREIVILVM